MGAHAVVDGAPYTVGCVYLGWRRAGDRRLVTAQVVDTLERALSAVPCDVATGLVRIDPSVDWDRCAWGFTDTVRKSGCCLMESLLLAEACERLAEIEEAVGRTNAARRNRERAARIVRKMDEVFWDASCGLYRAATVRNREHDVWASAFAVWKGYAPAAHADIIARNFRDRYGEYVRDGQVRHLPVGEYWERACAHDTYQNGGYWGTPAGWFAWTLARVDPERAVRMLSDLRTAYERLGAVEWSLGNVRAKASPYPAGLTLPLAAIRRLQKEFPTKEKGN